MKIRELHALLQKKEISARELYLKYREAAERRNPELNAYVAFTDELALKTAEEVEKRVIAGESVPTLAGIPMGLKDNICTKGELTTCCSKILQGFRPIYDASVWKKLYEDGAVMLGKTNMDEFAMGSASETSAYGAPLNPHDTRRVTGGSSGGSAAAVASGIAAYALGSDTGGSIRQPAAFCGLVGLKPTYGAVSRYGLIAYASSLDQIGPITTSVEDAAVVFDAISFADKKDNTSILGARTSTADKLKRGVKGLKIGWAKEYFNGISKEIGDKIAAAAKFYEKEGAEIVEISLPVLDHALPVYYILACAEASSNLGRYDGIRYGYRTEEYKDVNDMIAKTRSEGFGREVKRRIMLGTYVLSSGYYDAYYKKAQTLRGVIRGAFREVFEQCDVILAPTAPTAAFPLGYTSDNMIETYLSDVCTVPVNIAGLPAVSIPAGETAEGMPIGMQLIGKPMDEAVILNAAEHFEAAHKNIVRDLTETGVKL